MEIPVTQTQNLTLFLLRIYNMNITVPRAMAFPPLVYELFKDHIFSAFLVQHIGT